MTRKSRRGIERALDDIGSETLSTAAVYAAVVGAASRDGSPADEEARRIRHAPADVLRCIVPPSTALNEEGGDS